MWCSGKTGCAGGNDVVRCIWDGGHTWPFLYDGNQYAEMVWDFFMAHPKPNSLSMHSHHDPAVRQREQKALHCKDATAMMVTSCKDAPAVAYCEKNKLPLGWYIQTPPCLPLLCCS